MRTAVRFVKRQGYAFVNAHPRSILGFMKETLQDRIRKRLKVLGKNNQSASLEAGLSRDYLRTFLARENASPKADTLASIARVLGTTSHWLQTGQGEEDIESPTTPIDASIVWNVAYALHERGAFASTTAEQFANLALILCETLTEQPTTDLPSAITVAVRQGQLTR